MRMSLMGINRIANKILKMMKTIKINSKKTRTLNPRQRKNDLFNMF